MAKQYIEPTPVEVLREINFKPGFNQKASEKELIDYLKQYPFISPLLLEGFSRVKELYPDADFALDIFYDPEGPEEDSSLVLYFATALHWETASIIFDKFEEDWYIDAFSDGQGKFGIIMEFK
jgi:hypothetical protein